MTCNQLAHFPINFRVFLVVAVTTVAVIMCAYLFAVSRVLGIVIGCIVLTVIVGVAVVLAVLFSRGRIKLRYLITAALSAVIGISAFTVATVTIDNWDKGTEIGGYRSVVGRVASVDVRTGDYRIDLEKLTVDDKRVSGVLRLTIIPSDNNIGDYAECGDIFEFDAYITATKLYDDGDINGSAYRTNIRYYARVSSSNIRVKIGKPTIVERLLGSWRTLLTKYMGDRYGNIAFSMATGDKHSLDVDITNMFSVAGLGHIMAVSGLHIGFIVVLLNLILSKVDKRVRFGIVTAFLLLYCIIADFSPSVVRAFVMAEVSMFAVLVGGRRDILSSLCCSFSLILAVKPLYLLEAGFMLSFGALLGIALFAGIIARFLKKHGASDRLSKTMASAVSVQIGVAPATIYLFKSFQVFALIVNAVLIPYVSLVFTCIICCSVIGAIPFLGAVLKACEYLLIPLDYMAKGVGTIPFSSITVYSTAAVFLCYPVMFCASEFFMMKRGKLAVVLASVVVCTSFCFISPSPENGTVCVPRGSSDSVLVDGGSVIIVADDCNYYELCELLEKNRCRAIDELYLYSVNEKNAQSVIKLNERFGITAVYSDGFSSAAEYLINSGVNYRMVDGRNTFTPVYGSGGIVGYSYGKLLFASKKCDSRLFFDYSVVRVQTVTEVNDHTVYLTDYSKIDEENVLTTARGSYVYTFT